jgi:hypothetical protein
MPCAVDVLRNSLRAARDAESARLDAYEAQQIVRPRDAYARRPEFRALRDAGLQRLERFDRAIAYLRNEGGVKLGYLQERFLRAIRLVSLPKMLGERQLLANMPLLQRKYGVTSIEDTAAIIYPRRAGKTTVQCLAAAALAVSQPDGNIVCFNLYALSRACRARGRCLTRAQVRAPGRGVAQADHHLPRDFPGLARVCLARARPPHARAHLDPRRRRRHRQHDLGLPGRPGRQLRQ